MLQATLSAQHHVVASEDWTSLITLDLGVGDWHVMCPVQAHTTGTWTIGVRIRHTGSGEVGGSSDVVTGGSQTVLLECHARFNLAVAATVSMDSKLTLLVAGEAFIDRTTPSNGQTPATQMIALREMSPADSAKLDQILAAVQRAFPIG